MVDVGASLRLGLELKVGVENCFRFFNYFFFADRPTRGQGICYGSMAVVFVPRSTSA